MLRGSVRVYRGKNLARRGRVSIVSIFVEEDIILKGLAGLWVALGLFGEKHLQPNSDSILIQK